MNFEPQSLELMSYAEAEQLLIESESLQGFPEIMDTIMGDPEADVGILLLHGFCGTNLEMSYLANFLAMNGYRIFIPLLPGHGTTSDDLLQVTASDWIETVKNAYWYLANELDGRKIIVAGHSLGASLAIIIASQLPVDGLISIAGPVRYPIYLRILAKLGGKIGFKVKYDEFNFENEQLHNHPGIKHFVETYGRVPVKSFGDVFDVMEKANQALPNIDIPTSLIYAKKDRRVPPYHVDIITQNLGSSDIEVHWLSKSYHIIVIDDDRKLVIQKIVSFVDRCLDKQSITDL